MTDALGGLARATRTLSTEGRALLTIAAAGMVGPERPDRLWAMYRILRRYGPMGGAIGVAAVRHGSRAALIDERGTLTYSEMDRRSDGLANAWRARGLEPGDGVGILCRNHRGLLDASFAAFKCGCRVVYLNTDFSSPQAREVCEREGVSLLVHDSEFAEVASAVVAPRGRYVAWESGTAGDPASLESLIATANPAPPPAPGVPGTAVVLTSGTTGTPKGANRAQPRSITPLAAVLSRIPFRSGDVVEVAPPMFHAWGLGVTTLALGMGSTVVTHRRFDPEETLASMAAHRATALAVVPVLLNRLLALGPDRISAYDLGRLRIIASSGSRLEAALATRALDTFGDVLYNLYGSTEVAWATIATPQDLRVAPGSAGRPPLGTTIALIDESGKRVTAPGATGRIFVGSGLQFGGYTGGGTKEVLDGLMSTGDVGHIDAEGRLYVDGRDDEMIVSGGENVFPREVEELLAGHPAVMEAAAVGVDDEEFGQRLRVFVALRPGAALDAEEVRGYVRANLARYKVPRDVVFVDELPRNPSGKVLKRELGREE